MMVTKGSGTVGGGVTMLPWAVDWHSATRWVGIGHRMTGLHRGTGGEIAARGRDPWGVDRSYGVRQ